MKEVALDRPDMMKGIFVGYYDGDQGYDIISNSWCALEKTLGKIQGIEMIVINNNTTTRRDSRWLFHGNQKRFQPEEIHCFKKSK